MSTDIVKPSRKSALVALADRMGVEGDALFLGSLKAVAFKSPNATNEQLLALCVVANQYQLNPFLKELYAYPDKGGGIVPIVGVDGWIRIAVSHEQYDGCEVRFSDETTLWNGKQVPIWCEVTMYRKDHSRPRTHREYFEEVQRNTDPWKNQPRRMLEHKAFIQTARNTFGFAGIHEPDEAERVIESQAVRTVEVQTGGGNERLAARLPPAPVTPEHDDGGPTAEDIAGTVDHEPKADPLPGILESINKAKTKEAVDAIVNDEHTSGGHSLEVDRKIADHADIRKRHIAIESHKGGAK
jgi:phage recombination protein Bet